MSNNFQVKLWDNKSTFCRSLGGGHIETLYIRASSIEAAIARAMAHAKKRRYSSCRVYEAIEIEETVIV